jgi:hypothetical protein
MIGEDAGLGGDLVVLADGPGISVRGQCGESDAMHIRIWASMTILSSIPRCSFGYERRAEEADPV